MSLKNLKSIFGDTTKFKSKKSNAPKSNQQSQNIDSHTPSDNLIDIYNKNLPSQPQTPNRTSGLTDLFNKTDSLHSTPNSIPVHNENQTQLRNSKGFGDDLGLNNNTERLKDLTGNLPKIEKLSTTLSN